MAKGKEKMKRGRRRMRKSLIEEEKVKRKQKR